MQRRAWLVIGVSGAVVLTACSLLTDTDGLTGGTPDGGASSGGTNKSDGGASSGGTSGGRAGDDGGPGDDGSVDPVPALACPNAGRSCVADAPDGWTGPLIVYDGDENGVPKCPAEMNVAKVDTHRGFHAPAASTCSDCTCLSGSGVMCKAQLSATAGDCSDPNGTQDLTIGKCASVGGDAFKVTFTATGGSCPASGGLVQRAAIPWDSKTRACGADGLLRTGCPDGQICAPDPPSPFRAKHCVSKSGDVECPAPFTEKLLTNGVNDTRGCTSCSCGPPANDGCTGSAQVWNNTTTCSGIFPQNVMVGGDGCTPVTAGSMKLLFASATPSKCTPTGPAVPTGDVTAGAAVTVCCLP